jgi:hypothetical protein
MKVKIGPYRDWIGPYQIAEFLCFWVPEVEDEYGFRSKPDWVHDFGTWLAEDKDGNDSWLTRFCQWIQDHKKRKVKIHIDNYDVWSMDHTLSLIVLPMLKKLKEQKMGYSYISDEDVPAELGIRSTDCPKPANGVWDDNAEKRFNWMMEELIWTFTQLCEDDDGEGQFYDHTESNKEKDFNKSIQKLKVDREGLEAHQKRIDRGLQLFGKYLRTLWD